MTETEAATPGAADLRSLRRPHILIGVTSPQTCLVLQGRLRALRESGFRVSLLPLRANCFMTRREMNMLTAYAVPMKRGISPVADIIALFRIWRLLRHLCPDIVEFSTPKAGLLGSLAARLRGIPARVYFLRGLKLETALGLKRILLLMTERLASDQCQRRGMQ